MSARRRLLASGVWLVVLLTACAEAGTGRGRKEMEAVPGGETLEKEEVRYPVHDGPGFGDAGLAGRLTIQGECLQTGTGSGSLPVWPSSTSFRPDLDGGAIVGEDGEVIVRVGEKIPNAPTAVVPRELAEEEAGEELPEECGGHEVTEYVIIGRPFPAA